MGAHKSIKLTIHVPEEQARQVVDLFGWPTMVDPVPVALARLQEGGGARRPTRHPTIDTTPVPLPDKPAGRAKREWRELTPAGQAGIRCNEPRFQAFLREAINRFGLSTHDDCRNENEAAEIVRDLCRVESRSQINKTNPESLRLWHLLEGDYQLWLRRIRGCLTMRKEFPGKIRVAAWERSRGLCENCTKRLSPGDVFYEHLVPDGLTGQPTLENCGVYCKTCWATKTSHLRSPDHRQGQAHRDAAPRRQAVAPADSRLAEI